MLGSQGGINPDYWEARGAIAAFLNAAVAIGAVDKPARCEGCSVHHARLHGHHDDYTKPLNVRWLCPKCHRAEHMGYTDRRIAIIAHYLNQSGVAVSLQARLRAWVQAGNCWPAEEMAKMQNAAFQNINPRYAAYCRAHGQESVDAMLAVDRVRWPGGVMAGYTIWIDERWRDWLLACGLVRPGHSTWAYIKSERDHGDFDAWLWLAFP